MPDPSAVVTGWRPDITAPDAQAAVDVIVDAIRATCGWRIAPQAAETVTLDPPSGRWLYLPTLHLVTIDDVRLDGEPITGYSTSADGSLYHPCGWLADLGGVGVDMTHGHPEWPGDLTVVIAGAAVRSIDEGGRAGVGVLVDESLGEWSSKYDTPASTDPSGLTEPKSQQFATVASPVDPAAVINRYRLTEHSA